MARQAGIPEATSRVRPAVKRSDEHHAETSTSCPPRQPSGNRAFVDRYFAPRRARSNPKVTEPTRVIAAGLAELHTDDEAPEILVYQYFSSNSRV